MTADRAELHVLKKLLQNEPGVVFPKEAEETVCTASKQETKLLIGKQQKGIVKKSKSGLCHDPSSRWYKRTKNFAAFDSIKDCLDSGGRLPK